MQYNKDKQKGWSISNQGDDARRYTPRVTLCEEGKGRSYLHALKVFRINVFSLEDAKDKPMQKVAPIPAA
jgi:hypothetical protein